MLIRFYISANDQHQSVILDHDSMMFFKEGNLHRRDGPAYITTTGYCSWWLEGKKHRQYPASKRKPG